MIRILIFLLSIISIQMTAQTIPSTAEEMEKEYQSNIRKSRINGVYIPQDIGDAIDEILRLSPPESIMKFKNGDEELVVEKLHFGLGKWLALKWNFEYGSRYSHYLKEMGVSYPDDMIRFTIRSLHRHLNGTPMELKERANAIKIRRQTEHLERLQKGEVLDTLQQN